MDDGECAIPMCGSEEGLPLAPVCENGHRMHAECLRMVAQSGNPVCPMCRSSAASVASLTAAPVPLEALLATPYSVVGAFMAVCVGKMQRA